MKALPCPPVLWPMHDASSYATWGDRLSATCSATRFATCLLETTWARQILDAAELVLRRSSHDPPYSTSSLLRRATRSDVGRVTLGSLPARGGYLQSTPQACLSLRQCTVTPDIHNIDPGTNANTVCSLRSTYCALQRLLRTLHSCITFLGPVSSRYHPLPSAIAPFLGLTA